MSAKKFKKAIERKISPVDLFSQKLKGMRQTEPGIMRTISKFSGDPRHAILSPKKYPLTVSIRPVHKQLVQKDDTLLSRTQVLGRIKGYQNRLQNDFYHISNVPSLPTRRLNDVQTHIWLFFQDPDNKKEVFDSRISIKNQTFHVYAVKSKKRVSILIYKDGEVSNVIHHDL